MKKKKTYSERVNSFLYNHLWLKYLLEYGLTFLMTVFSALIFVFGLKVFLKPGCVDIELVSGGSSGLAQVINLIFAICGVEKAKNSDLIFTLAYAAINLPLIVLAFVGIGKRFGAFTLINVGCVTLFTNLFGLPSIQPFFESIAIYIDSFGGLLARSIFAGICTGLSSAIAYKFDTSAGGFDIVSYYLSIKKSTSTGKFIVVINGFIVGSFYLITALTHKVFTVDEVSYSGWAVAIGGVFFSVMYLFAVMLLVDSINVRNKKVQLEIITTKENLASLLLARIPHGATVIKGKGAYSGVDRYMIYMVISSVEIKNVIKVIDQLDSKAFVNVIPITHVYGRFFIKPVK